MHDLIREAGLAVYVAQAERAETTESQKTFLSYKPLCSVYMYTCIGYFQLISDVVLLCTERAFDDR